MSKVAMYPRPHNFHLDWMMNVYDATATSIPLLMYDEGLGAPSSYNAHPEHASFAETNEPNVYPESRVNKLFAKLEFMLTHIAVSTDELTHVKVGVIPYYLAFKEDYDANDEKSTETISTILELDKETTDR